MLKMSFTTKDGTLVNTIFPKKNLKGHNRIFIGERNGKDSCRVILWIWTTTDHLYLSLYISLCAVNDLQLKPAEKKKKNHFNFPTYSLTFSSIHSNQTLLYRTRVYYSISKQKKWRNQDSLLPQLPQLLLPSLLLPQALSVILLNR